MRKLFLWSGAIALAMALRVLWIISLFTVIILGLGVYKNYYYFTTELKNSDKISLLNYHELPKLVESWPGTEKLISERANRHELHGNEPVKRVQFSKNKLTASLFFARPDTEDNADKRSAVITYEPLTFERFPAHIVLKDSVLFAVVRPRGNIIGNGYQRSRVQLELVDGNGKVMKGPKVHLSTSGEPTYLILRPTVEEPIPTGSTMEGFDPNNVRRINIRFIAGRYPDGLSHFPVQGELSIDNIYLIKNIKPIVNFFGQPSLERVTRDNINLSYKLRKYKWDSEETPFFVGINYPWNNYGWDLGRNPYGEPANSGWSANEKKLREDFTYLKSAGVEPVRIYFFFDLRTGLHYTDGKLTGFDTYVRKDIEAVIRIAGATGIKIIPVLFDFGIADGNGNGVGEHPELIFSSDKHNFLINVMRPLLQDIEKWNNHYGKPIFALELMNEPENMAALIIPGYFQSLKNWLQDLANIIHNETSLKVTLGSHSIVDMQRWWDGIDIDIWQFHFYKYMFYEHEKWPQSLKRKEIKIPGVIFSGEMQPFDIVANIETIKNNGYGGILFWSFNANDGFRMRETPQIEELVNWLKENKKIETEPKKEDK